MIQHQTDTYIKICMKNWLLCESCVHEEINSSSPRYNIISECTACAQACFAVVARLVSKANDLDDLVLNCILHCRQCFRECMKYAEEPDMEACAEICNSCAETIKNLAEFSLN